MKTLLNDLKLFDLLRDGQMKLTDIAKKLLVSKQAISKRLRPWIKKGVVIKRGYGVWEVDETQLKKYAKDLYKKSTIQLKLRSSNESQNFKENTIRGHGFLFTLKFPRPMDDFTRRKTLDVNGISWEEYQHPAFKAEKKIVFTGWKCRMTKNTLMCWMDEDRSIFSEDAEENLLEAIYRWKSECILKFEKMFKRSFKMKLPSGQQGYNFRTGAQHHALIKNADAMMLRLEKKKVYVYGTDNGELWLLADYSGKVDEMEAVNKDTSPNNANLMSRHYNSIKDTGMTYYDVIDGFERTQKQINSLVENNHEYAINIKAHIGAIKSLGSGINQFNKEIGKLTKKPRIRRNSKNRTLSEFT